MYYIYNGEHLVSDLCVYTLAVSPPPPRNGRVSTKCDPDFTDQRHAFGRRWHRRICAAPEAWRAEAGCVRLNNALVD